MSRASTERSVYSKFDDEHSVATGVFPKRDRKLHRRKRLLILLYVCFVLAWVVLLAVLQTYAAYVGALSLLSLCVLIFFTWRYAKVEYELTVHKGVFGIAIIYGGLTRKDLFSCRVSDLDCIAPYTEEVERIATKRRLTVCSGVPEKQVWYALRRLEDGERMLIVFDAEERLLKVLRYYGAAAFLSVGGS